MANNLLLDDDLYKDIMEAETPEDCVKIVRSIKLELEKNQVSRKNPTPGQLVDFLKYASNIKETERRGWILYGLEGTETVACHMYRMALMAMIIEKSGLNRDRCVQMALVHDLAESIVGDITPECGEAMQTIAGTMEGTDVAETVRDLWLEYEENKTMEARFLHDLDKLEFALQSMEYEKKFGVKLDHFLDKAGLCIMDPFMREIFSCIMNRRSIQ